MQPIKRPQPTNRPQTTAPSVSPPTVNIPDAIRRAKESAQAAVGSFAGSETKERWWSENSQLWLHSLALGDGQFGPQWTLAVSEETTDGLVVRFSLSDNAYRSVYFSNLNDLLTLTKQVIGPFALSKFMTPSGQESWTFDAWSAEATTNQPF